MGKILILSVTDHEEHILNKIMETIANEPELNHIAPPLPCNILSFTNLEIRLKEQTVSCSGQLVIVSVIVATLEMITVSDTGILGCIMNIVQTLSFACTASIIYKKKHTLSGALIGLASGWLITVIVMLLWNYLVTPLYMGYPREAVVELLLPAFLPFNLLKGGLNASITFLLYKPIVTALRKSGYISTLEKDTRQQHTGLLILANFIIVTCVLIILSMNGII